MGLMGRQPNRYDKIDHIMGEKFVEWKVDKQVIVVPPESNSTDLVRHGVAAIVDFTWPWVLRVTITNKTQTHLIGDTGMGYFDRLVREAEEQCVFLNANRVR